MVAHFDDLFELGGVESRRVGVYLSTILLSRESRFVQSAGTASVEISVYEVGFMKKCESLESEKYLYPTFSLDLREDGEVFFEQTLFEQPAWRRQIFENFGCDGRYLFHMENLRFFCIVSGNREYDDLRLVSAIIQSVGLFRQPHSHGHSGSGDISRFGKEELSVG
jgi:hypothetical protein